MAMQRNPMLCLSDFVERVPNQCKHPSDHKPDATGHDDQNYRFYEIEWFDDINRFDEMHPEDKIDNRLGPP